MLDLGERAGTGVKSGPVLVEGAGQDGNSRGIAGGGRGSVLGMVVCGGQGQWWWLGSVGRSGGRVGSGPVDGVRYSGGWLKPLEGGELGSIPLVRLWRGLVYGFGTHNN